MAPDWGVVKKCSKCGEAKPVSEFHKHTGHLDGLASNCKDCHRASVRVASAKYKQKNTTAYKASQVRHKLKRTYGITPCDFTRQLIQQDGKCPVCGTTDPGGKGSWHVDHDHSSGVLRGLLCHHCNVALGHLRDSQETLGKAITYLDSGGIWKSAPVSA